MERAVSNDELGFLELPITDIAGSCDANTVSGRYSGNTAVGDCLEIGNITDTYLLTIMHIQSD